MDAFNFNVNTSAKPLLSGHIVFVKNPNLPETAENLIPIVLFANNPEEAMNIARMAAPQDAILVYKASQPISQWLELIQQKDKDILAQYAAPKEQVSLGLDGFLVGLTMAAKEYVKEEKDKDTLFRIIDEIRAKSE